MAGLPRLTARAAFQAVAAARRKWVTETVIIQYRPIDRLAENALPVASQSLGPVASQSLGPESLAPEALPRYGLTASKHQVGNAVARNRARRRLRALAENLLRTAPAGDYVLIARAATVRCEAAKLAADFAFALSKLRTMRQNSRHA